MLRSKSFQRAFVAAWAVIASGPVFFIVQAGYPPLSFLIAAAAIASALPAFAIGAAASTGRLGSVASAVAIGVTAAAFHSPWDSLLWLAVMPVLVGMLALWVHLKGDRVIGMIAVVFAAIGLLSPLNVRPFFKPAPGEVPSNDLPPIVHVILDEHGPGGWPEFAHWPRAYSRHFHTVNAIPDMLDGYEARLRDKGYAVETWQSEFLEFCNTNCATYGNASLTFLSDLPFQERSVIALSTYVRKRPMLESVFPNYWLPTPINAERVFGLFTDRLQRLQPGEAVIFHSLLPHYPWAFDANCARRPLNEWGYRSRDTLAIRHERYQSQRSCTESILAEAIPESAIVVLHGDHGNRILDRDPLYSEPVDDNLNAQAFTTLFAMRIPGTIPETFDQRVSVPSLLREWDFETYPQGERETIFLDDKLWRPRREIEMAN